MTGRVTMERASAVLGLAPGASPDAVRAAFRRRAQEVHPDRPTGSAAAFREVAAARDVLLGAEVDAEAWPGWGGAARADEQPWPWSETSERSRWGDEEPRRGGTSSTSTAGRARPVATPTAPAWRVHLPVLGGALAVWAAVLVLAVLMSSALFAVPIVVAAVLVAVMTGWSAIGRLRRGPAGRMVFGDDSDA